MQLLRLLNRLLDKHPESRRRHLTFHTPAIVPVWMQVRPPRRERGPLPCTLSRGSLNPLPLRSKMKGLPKLNTYKMFDQFLLNYSLC